MSGSTRPLLLEGSFSGEVPCLVESDQLKLVALTRYTAAAIGLLGVFAFFDPPSL
jgi:hypothetical protein